MSAFRHGLRSDRLLAPMSTVDSVAASPDCYSTYLVQLGGTCTVAQRLHSFDLGMVSVQTAGSSHMTDSEGSTPLANSQHQPNHVQSSARSTCMADRWPYLLLAPASLICLYFLMKATENSPPRYGMSWCDPAKYRAPFTRLPPYSECVVIY